MSVFTKREGVLDRGWLDGALHGRLQRVAVEKPPAALHKQAMSRGTCLHGGLPLDVVDGVSPLLSRISPVV